MTPREVREGRANLLVATDSPAKGPGTRSALPFYNAAMRPSRDLTLLFLAAWAKPRATVLDGLAGTGVLGIRAALEAARDLAVTWNDKNPRSHALIQDNVRRNGLLGDVRNEDLRSILATGRFDYVDVDPFGPPAPFVDLAMQGLWRGRAVGFTATDTAPLAGTYPETCRRRYGARSMRNPCGPETALRIFLGHLARVAATHDRGLRPLLSFSTGHFVRAIITVEPGAKRAAEALASLGYVRFEGARFEVSETPPGGSYAGPLWTGPLADDALLEGIPPSVVAGNEAMRVWMHLQEENPLPPFYYENASLAKSLSANAIPAADLVESLRAAGFRACRTHFTPNAVRTDAPWDEVARRVRRG